MILIADGGSTKTEWRLVNESDSFSLKSAGINPFFNSKEQIIDELNSLELPLDKASIRKVFFYGAGLTEGNAQKYLESAFKSVFNKSQIFLHDDLTATSRALFADKSGIACILGTGSNSGLFINGRLEDKIPALGYILGDEGSGADIGIRLLNALLKRRLPPDISDLFNKNECFEMNKVLDRVYRQNFPNRYLASFTTLIKENLNYPEIRSIVLDSFHSFTEKNILKYRNFNEFEIGFSGSVAYHFQDQLKEVLNEYNLKFKKIIRTPIDDLVIYHRNLELN